ncbi:BCCT family transporter [Leisingera sp. ANG-Vp]|uniref:BCCT family transporter n=1 Tax=Leisingera sp. ANG-Vp TaxID=1577896 RepID=UPI0006911CD4|nr:BCCT family transporter [Leisingera sp. ANG-Vp]
MSLEQGFDGRYPYNAVASTGLLKGVHARMSIASKLMVIAFVVFTVANVEFASGVFDGVKSWITSTLSWYYILMISIFLLFSIWLAFSRYGHIRLGKDSDRPEFGNFSWFAMLFSAGMGNGVLFWSIAEPMYHLQGNPFIEMAGTEANSALAASTAMLITAFHWGVHGWAVYVIVALSLAYFAYRKGLPLSMRSTLYPLIGDRIYGFWGHAADLLAIFGTIFGVATTLGLGVQQMNTGLSLLTGIANSTTNQIILIAIVTGIATLSAVSGVSKGIRIISELNMWLTFAILAFFLFAGPTVYLLGQFVNLVGNYVQNFVPMGLWVDEEQGRQWQGWWTVFYWGWWIAWSPFVGLFIARVSKGRTLREFVVALLIVPPLVTMFLLAMFGGNAVSIELQGAGGIIEAVNESPTLALYATLEGMDVGLWGTAFAAIVTFLIASYFITSSDSGTLVICTMLAMGSQHPPRLVRIFWGVTEGVVASVLLVAGGLVALQTASIAAALPFSIVILLMMISLYKALKEELPAK